MSDYLEDNRQQKSDDEANAAAQNLPKDLDFKIQMQDNNSFNEQKKQKEVSPKVQQSLEKPLNSDVQESQVKSSIHPWTCFFAICFKALAILSYYIIEAITGETINAFILTLMFTCMDFWTVKNVVGRKLVGLKWWSEFQDNGQEKWLFESVDPNIVKNEWEERLFWISNVILICLWTASFLANLILLKFFWALLNLVCDILHCVNFYGFYKCRGEHQKKVKHYLAKVGFKMAMNNM